MFPTLFLICLAVHNVYVYEYMKNMLKGQFFKMYLKKQYY